jgi:uncharacterized protein (DUF58 family)
MVEDEAIDARVYATLAHLRGLEHRARRFTFLPRQPAGSALNGRHASRIRGRGLNFEEIRAYLPGDDVRSIDWKVTARTREPHVRVMTEERDRPALIVVDQRLSMFFGSRHNMKSVTAAELAALAAWRVLAAGDRVGGIVFDDEHSIEVRPQRSRRAVNRFLEKVSEANLSLRADSLVEPAPEMLARALESASRIASHDTLLVLISDFDGADDGVRKSVARMARHNDVVLALVHDPMAHEMPDGGTLVVGDGRLQLSLDLGDRRIRDRLETHSGARIQGLLDWQAETGAAVLPVSAGEDTATQLHALMGLAPRRRVG